MTDVMNTSTLKRTRDNDDDPAVAHPESKKPLVESSLFSNNDDNQMQVQEQQQQLQDVVESSSAIDTDPNAPDQDDMLKFVFYIRFLQPHLWRRFVHIIAPILPKALIRAKLPEEGDERNISNIVIREQDVTMSCIIYANLNTNVYSVNKESRVYVDMKSLDMHTSTSNISHSGLSLFQKKDSDKLEYWCGDPHEEVNEGFLPILSPTQAELNLTQIAGIENMIYHWNITMDVTKIKEICSYAHKISTDAINICIHEFVETDETGKPLNIHTHLRVQVSESEKGGKRWSFFTMSKVDQSSQYESSHTIQKGENIKDINFDDIPIVYKATFPLEYISTFTKNMDGPEIILRFAKNVEKNGGIHHAPLCILYNLGGEGNFIMCLITQKIVDDEDEDEDEE